MQVTLKRNAIKREIAVRVEDAHHVWSDSLFWWGYRDGYATRDEAERAAEQHARAQCVAWEVPEPTYI